MAPQSGLRDLPGCALQKIQDSAHSLLPSKGPSSQRRRSEISMSPALDPTTPPILSTRVSICLHRRALVLDTHPGAWHAG